MTPPWVEIPAGRGVFGGGPDDKFVNATELPRSELVIAEPFRMAIVPVSLGDWGEWKADDTLGKGAPFSGEGDPLSGEGDPALPVTGVSWFEAEAYCSWLSERIGETWRLPNEREWEYACRAGTGTPFATGNAIGTTEANFFYDEDGSRIGAGELRPAGQFEPNAFGLHDMHGNVCEWTADPWRPTLEEDEPEDPGRRVVRGGGWDYLPRMLRSSWRDGLPPETKRDNLGFRVVSGPVTAEIVNIAS